jgi:hypothetical protein
MFPTSLLQSPYFDHIQLRARSALAAAATAVHPEPYLACAWREARRLDRQKTPWAEALARLIRAGVAAFRGDRASAGPLLEEAISRFEAEDMGLFAAAAKRRLGELRGGTQGQALVAEADAWMTGRGIVNPARMAATFAPGFPE